MISYKRLFARSFDAAPGRLHFAAHSHHLWPDASFDGQVECWHDAARLADTKWDRVMGEVWPEAQREVAAEIGSDDPSAVLFATNTHDFLIRLAAACPRRCGDPLRVLASDGEFHSARRQLARWIESGEVALTSVAAEPHDDFTERFIAAGRAGDHDLIFVSHTMFGSGRIVDAVERLAALADPAGPWVVIDGYHSFMSIPRALGPTAAPRAFFVAGGYKYAMAGEGVAMMHCPPGFGPRPPLTGWYAEFDDLSLPAGMVGYAADAMRFMGATFDSSGLYRFIHVRRMLAAEGLDTAAISARVAELQAMLLDALAGTPLAEAELLNPLVARQPHARFLALRDPRAASWCAALAARHCMTDVRGDVLRIGLGLYHDPADVAELAALAAAL